ncbi:MAG: LacI family DNA-binding transcriptional regulator [Woeseiaceae bacterium]|nr:LacI family DNA-binding transcriptional regulator [Woeseiaceae bacterium]
MSNARSRPRRVTIKDIARAASVDPSTVTRALQQSPRVKPATREKIAALAADMGYVPDMAARTLVMRRTGLIGVVIPDMTNPFFRDLGQGIEDEAAKHGLRVLINDTRGIESAEREAVRLFQELQVEGIIVPMARCPQSYYERVREACTVVQVNRPDASFHVSCDTIEGSLLIMRHLLDLGHRRIGFVSGPAIPGEDPKMLAYRAALEEAGIDYDPNLIFGFDGTLKSSSAIVDQLLGLRKRPTAVFAHNDINAIAMLRGLRECGIAVPDDISIAGHDNIRLSAYVEPPLTTVAWPMYELGQKSVRYLYSLSHGKRPRKPRVSAPELIVRESTGGPKAARRKQTRSSV